MPVSAIWDNEDDGVMVRNRGLPEAAMTKIQIDLPEATAEAARKAGLLTSEALERLLVDAIKRHAGQRLVEVARKIRDAGIEPMTMAEIDEEVKAVRAERRERAFDRLLALAPALEAAGAPAMSEDEILAEVEAARAAARADAGVADRS